MPLEASQGNGTQMSEATKPVESESVLIRDGTPDDHPLIYSTVLKGLYYGNEWFNLIRPKDVFMAAYHQIIERLLASPTTAVKVACLKSDPTTVLGYAIFHLAGENRCLDWVFVKRRWRGIGIAKSLVPVDEVNTVTHLTKTGVTLLYDHPHIQFNPFT